MNFELLSPFSYGKKSNCFAFQCGKTDGKYDYIWMVPLEITFLKTRQFLLNAGRIITQRFITSF